MAIRLDSKLRTEYEDLFASCEVATARKPVVLARAKKILNGRPNYKAIEGATGVPWFIVGALHSLESGCDFERHLHNGDSLKAPTVHVPRNRPPGNPPCA